MTEMKTYIEKLKEMIYTLNHPSVVNEIENILTNLDIIDDKYDKINNEWKDKALVYNDRDSLFSAFKEAFLNKDFKWFSNVFIFNNFDVLRKSYKNFKGGNIIKDDESYYLTPYNVLKIYDSIKCKAIDLEDEYDDYIYTEDFVPVCEVFLHLLNKKYKKAFAIYEYMKNKEIFPFIINEIFEEKGYGFCV